MKEVYPEDREPLIEKTYKGNRLCIFLRGWFSLADALIQILSLGRLSGNIHFNATFEWGWFQELETKQALKG